MDLYGKQSPINWPFKFIYPRDGSSFPAWFQFNSDRSTTFVAYVQFKNIDSFVNVDWGDGTKEEFSYQGSSLKL